MRTAFRLLLLLSIGWGTSLILVKGPGDPYPCVKLVKDINPNGSSVASENSFPEGDAVFKGALYFGAAQGIVDRVETGIQLWKTDGTEGGTVLVKTICAGCNAAPEQFTVVGETLFFAAFHPVSGRELWKTDGTTAGTVLVKDIQPGAGLGSPPIYLKNVNGTLLFAADDTPDQKENYKLWKSDGTAAGTVPIKAWSGEEVTVMPSIYQPIAVMNGVYYFNSSGLLWRSNGTAFGTYKVINGVTSPESLAVANGKLFFRAYDGDHGQELWKTDGTNAGTVLVKDITPGPASTSTGSFFSDGTTLFFAAATQYGTELWKSNGTAAGTVMVKDINLTATVNSTPQNLTTFDGTLFFKASDGVHGFELWKSNGTAAGTVQVKNINDPTDWPPGELSGSSHPKAFQERNGKLYFSAYRFFYGKELWVTDGTTAGTVMVKDINPQGDSSPSQLVVVNNKLLFFADDGEHGREVFSYGLCGSYPTSPEGRTAAAEAEDQSGLQLKVLENPVHHIITAEVSGVTGQSVSFLLIDLQGIPLQKRTVEAAKNIERQKFDVGRQPVGTLLLRAVSGSESRTVRVITTTP